nr:bifunctional phosphopantothenoylcysteine decarboxylase/phosphopantothenate--cysteine ligase CoaBC [Sedimentibacter sp.]
MLKGKNILLAVTGSIAAYKIANLASMLKKLNCNVTVLMTRNATNFINPITFETLTGNKCLIDTFDRNFEYSVEHVSLAKKADVVLIAPATANIIGKIANGIADDMLTTTVMACTCKKIIAPAMNTNMYNNPVVQDNIQKLKHYNMEVITPDTGMLACGDLGEGKMPSEQVLLEYILKEVAHEKDMKGLNVLVTAGPTREKIDPVRFISNHSTGKMGYAIAKHCMLRGANVTLITGKTSNTFPPFVDVIEIDSAHDMFDAVKANYESQNIIIKAAAVADYCPQNSADEKIKKKDGDLSIALKRTDDILMFIGENRKEGQFICGFSMETENMLENSKAKLEKKHVDMIVANNLKQTGAGFGTDTNIVTFITKNDVVELEIMSKDEVSEKLIDYIMMKMTTQNKL